MNDISSSHKVIYVFPHPPTIDFSKKFFTKQLQKEYETEYWDIGPMLGYNMKFTYDLNDERLKLRKISGLFELYKNLERQNKQTTVFVIQITRMLNSLFFYYIFSALKLKTITLARGYLPNLTRSQRSLTHYLRRLLKPHQLKIWLWHIAYISITKLIPIRNYDLAFVAGKLAEKINLPQANKLVEVHHSDIDISINDEPCYDELPENFCVFLDDFLPFHPDFAITGSATVKAEEYYESVNRFFSMVESSTGLQVVIAAHPKALYEQNPFLGRLIVFNKTNALIKKSSLVLAHASTAVSFVVFHKKPLLLVSNNEIRKTHPVLFNSMVGTSNVLGCSLVDMDSHIFVDVTNFKVDAERYNQYMLEYLTQINVNVESFPILKMHLQDLFNSDGRN
jgi:hypothetical protein